MMGIIIHRMVMLKWGKQQNILMLDWKDGKAFTMMETMIYS